MLESVYSTSPETLSVLLADASYQFFTEHNEDSHNMNFELWKAAFVAGRLA